jgi:hypothetical protein
MPGLALIGFGCAIILSMIMPPKFWWFALGVALIAAGLYLMKRC